MKTVKNEKVLTPKLVIKLWIAFISIIVLMGISYILITGYYTREHNQATIQKLHAGVADHIIDEKFKDASPFLENGEVNKALFGDLMHDMMAVNRSIEVYLLDEKGLILYSVVLDHDENSPSNRVSLTPIEHFIATGGQEFILGDDPRAKDEQKIFSAARFESNGKNGYLYIILAGQDLKSVSSTLFGTYFTRLGGGALLLSMIFAALLGFLSIWFFTKNLRLILRTVKRFQAGDLQARISNPEKSDIAVFATSFNQMADTITENIEKIKSVDALRRELIANVSHDLRTPLAILKGYAETLQMKKASLSPEEQNEYLNIIQGNVDRLSRLIDQLFQYSKLEAEQVTPIMEPFSITELSHDLMAKFNLIAAQKNVKLALENPSDNCMVYADISLMERVLQNLIENALKYTEEGGSVTLSIVQNQNDTVEVKITDTGDGIPEKEQPYIFDRYKQINPDGRKQGTGLGLAIVKKIMDLHNTTITVLSIPRQGSSFSFRLPSYQVS
ncbi:ATP-binding protein [Flavobacteriaceae bacterium M23B6Z8]